MADDISDIVDCGRFTWQPWGDGSSEEGFGNITDNKNGVIIAHNVHEDYGRLFCDVLNGTIKAAYLK